MTAKAKASPKSTIGDVIAQLTSELAELRQRRVELLNQLDDIEHLPLPAEELQGRIAGIVLALQNQARELVPSGLLHPDSRAGNLAGAMLGSNVRPVALMAAVHPDAVKQWLTVEAKNELKTLPPALPTAERTKRMTELQAQILEVECQEADLLWSGEEAGITLPWRSDHDPVAVLGLE
jgi:hypothetical protein